MNKLALTLVMVSIGMSDPACAGPGWTGNDLKPKCDTLLAVAASREVWTQDTALATGQCTGFVEGVIQSTEFDSQPGKGGKWIFCVPKNSTPVQDVAVVVKYLEAHPDQWNFPANTVVAVALIDAFPCGKK
jgi:hypothetical protein